MAGVADRRAAFRALHETGCFVLPNPWDVGSARRLAGLGFPALASTSWGAAVAMGLSDGQLSRDAALAHLAMLVQATELPVNADFEAGFADAPDQAAANAVLAADTGVAGLSIEDRTGGTLYDFDLAVARIRAVRAALDPAVMLIARTEGYLVGRPDRAETIRRMTAFAEAGADCLYAPGMSDLGDIAALVQAVAPKPVNVLLWGDAFTVADVAAIGVRRVSTGSALARAAWDGFDAAAAALADQAKDGSASRSA
ncbi:isocitrate lyase/PEP mutase family protein [Sphingomonas quercus]|uniref:Isocitrate lyase/phosphoenolpyruvate mutase family protein n=1 Tax=Sphingomonas quercus TaxID=2842451 RepID=A0ABS6BIS0_9SPHN|nr:isocitrate lyase/phosphoenolpyruvate mutase family protein [Sphingomonas quercus]MBU3077124.1 isocitrate lyase/phosphoenolpyruvate mutase family protein [Sphingomonas quercus]